MGDSGPPLSSSLPSSPRLDVGALSRLFAHTTTSYKYLFFLSLLEIVKKHRFNPNQAFDLTEIETEMLVKAWYPHTYFHLNFGTADKIAEAIDQLPDSELPSPTAETSHTEALRKVCTALTGKHELGRWVPYRLLQPFFTQELSGMPDQFKNQEIVKLARSKFAATRPLYYFTQDESSILIHAEWAAYFRDNLIIVEDWAKWNWLDYMQRRNPAVPNLMAKLSPPSVRSTLKTQRQYWRSFIESSTEPVRCLYTGTVLGADDFALDHFLPWSFVCHDQLWNLTPVTVSANSSKSNLLPDPRYLEELSRLHAKALVTSQQAMNRPSWQHAVEPYVNDLHLTFDELTDTGAVHSAYRSHVIPMLELAATQGFEPGWRWTSADGTLGHPE